MNIRRVVVGKRDGKSVFLSDGEAPHTYHYKSIPGFATSLIWQTNEDSQITEGLSESVEVSSSLLPTMGESKFLMVTFPPMTVFITGDFDVKAADSEQRQHLIGLYDHFDPDNPGRHETATIDYGVVTKGPIWLELDDGDCRQLLSGDVIIQQGNAHAWKNLGHAPATVLFVLMGARA